MIALGVHDACQSVAQSPLASVQFNAVSIMNSSSLMTQGEHTVLNLDPRRFRS